MSDDDKAKKSGEGVGSEGEGVDDPSKAQETGDGGDKGDKTEAEPTKTTPTFTFGRPPPSSRFSPSWRPGGPIFTGGARYDGSDGPAGSGFRLGSGYPWGGPIREPEGEDVERQAFLRKLAERGNKDEETHFLITVPIQLFTSHEPGLYFIKFLSLFISEWN